jgi:hypothetical protein
MQVLGNIRVVCASKCLFLSRLCFLLLLFPHSQPATEMESAVRARSDVRTFQVISVSDFIRLIQITPY